MKRHLVNKASILFLGAILLAAVPVLGDCPDQVRSAPPQLTELQEQIPSYLNPYYPYCGVKQYGAHELAELLEQHTWLESHYKTGSFDCSEMSALLEKILEDHGWNTYIACGPTPFKSGSRHAWLMVETLPGIYMPVEAAVPRIVYRSDPFFDEYFEYDRLF